MIVPTCRSCGAELTVTVIDLGLQPLSNAYLEPDGVADELMYPLHARFCSVCFLVQVDDVVLPEAIFSDYSYFSSYSESWVEHARAFVAAATERFAIGSDGFVVELASNDGYLLQHVVASGIRALGIEPAANVAEVAVAAGIPTDVSFFGAATAADVLERHGAADLIVANNVFAHVPDLNDFTAGLRTLVADGGAISIEVPHLLRLVDEVQFDTIYHEHFSYFSLLAATAVLERHELIVFDVEQLPTHGGSLRIFAAPLASGRAPSGRVASVLDAERAAALDRPEGFAPFAARVEDCRDCLVAYLDERHDQGDRVAAYGAAAKGNTLLNYAGTTADRIGYVVDRNPHKQGRLLPGSHIPIRSVDRLVDDRPDVVLILPWNLQREIVGQLPEVRGWGGRWVVAVPTTREV